MILEQELYQRVKEEAEKSEEARKFLEELDRHSEFLDKCKENGYLRMDKNGQLYSFHLKSLSVGEAEKIRAQVRQYNRTRRALLKMFPPVVPDASKETIDTCVQMLSESAEEYDKELGQAEENLGNMPEHSYSLTSAIASHFPGLVERYNEFQKATTKKELFERTDLLKQKFRDSREAILSSVREADAQEKVFSQAISSLREKAASFRKGYMESLPREMEELRRIKKELEWQSALRQAESINLAEGGAVLPASGSVQEEQSKVFQQSERLAEIDQQMSRCEELVEQFKKNEQEVISRADYLEAQREQFRKMSKHTVSYTAGKAYEAIVGTASNLAERVRNAGNWIRKGYQRLARQAMDFGQRKLDKAISDSREWCSAMKYIMDEHLEKGKTILTPFHEMQSKLTEKVFHRKTNVEKSIESSVREWLDGSNPSLEALSSIVVANMQRDGIPREEMQLFFGQAAKEQGRDAKLAAQQGGSKIPPAPSPDDVSRMSRYRSEEKVPPDAILGDAPRHMNPEEKFVHEISKLPPHVQKALEGFEKKWERDTGDKAGFWSAKKLVYANNFVESLQRQDGNAR